MGFVVLSKELGVDLVDQNGAVKQQNVIVTQGNKLPPNVSPFTVNALRSAGVIAYVEDGPVGVPTIREIEPPAQVRTPDQPPVLPSDPVGNRIVAGDPDARPVQTVVDFGQMDPKDTVVAAGAFVGGTRTVADEPADEPASAERPKVADNKQAWEDYAVGTLGMDRGEAESLTKKDLVAEVERRETDRQV